MKILLAVIVYFVALPTGLLLAVAVYHGLAAFERFGAVGRWLARCVAGCLACEFFVAAFLLSGTGSVLSRDGIAPSWREAMIIGLIMGLGYATLWPWAEAFQRARSHTRFLA